MLTHQEECPQRVVGLKKWDTGAGFLLETSGAAWLNYTRHSKLQRKQEEDTKDIAQFETR